MNTEQIPNWTKTARFYVIAFLVIFYYWMTRPTSVSRSMILDQIRGTKKE